MTVPLVSVLMPVFNSEKYLREAVESILNQTFTDFEFIIINDGSADNSRAILESYHDPRIILQNNLVNLGISSCLNMGLNIARGKYVVRMDADDISLPMRISQQVNFMEEHTEIGVCGTWVKLIGNNAEQVLKLPTNPAIIKCHFLFGTKLAHPSVIMRRRLFVDNRLFYNPIYKKAQDYELWTRCSRFVHFANLSEALILYRKHPEQASILEYENQQKFADQVRMRELKNLGIDVVDKEFQLHQIISSGRKPLTSILAARVQHWLDKLHTANSKSRYYPEPEFSHSIENLRNNIQSHIIPLSNQPTCKIRTSINTFNIILD